MRSKGKLAAAATLAAMIVLLVIVATNVQAIADWYRLRGYNPPVAITSLANEDQLTDHAKHILYVAHPILETNPTTFLQDCPQAEQTIVLGCYRSGIAPFTQGNYLYVKQVSDSRLHGVEEVTTAHEMLHAAYDRLSSSQKKNVNAMLLDYYNHDLHDQRILDTINSYKQSEPNDVVNEMHSVFGTEISSLPAPLEDYYKQYFTNRSVVVNFASGYEGEFTSRINRINADDVQLAGMKQNIDAEEQQLASELANIESQRASVQRSNNSSAINDYNAQVTTYNRGVRTLQSDITEYNLLVDERNNLAQEIRNLQSSLDSRLTPQTAQ